MPFNFAPKSSLAEASVSISTTVLASYLSAVNPIIPKKTTIPILKFVRINVVDGNGYLTVSDSDCFAALDVSDAIGKGAIDLAVEYSALHNIANKAPNGTMLIERSGNELSFKANCTNCGKVVGVPGNDCPFMIIPRDTKLLEKALTDFDIRYVDKWLSPFCSDDKQYPTLSGVLLSLDGVQSGFATTNRTMMVCTNFIAHPSFTCSLPLKAFKVLDALGGEVTLNIYQSMYMFKGKAVSVYGKYIGGAYPQSYNLLRLLSAEHEYKVDVPALRAATQRLLNVVPPTKKGLCPVMLTYGAAGLGVTEVPDNYEFDKGGVKLDAHRLLDTLERFSDNSDVTFQSIGILERPTMWIDGRATTLLMPLR